MAATGVDGLFTFEGQHDVFFPLVAACAGGDLDVDLMTNVAMAFPRSPMHMAYAAYDLQTLSRGRFRLGLGSQIKPAHRASLREHLVAAGGPDARDRAGHQGDPQPLGGPRPARLSRRVHHAHAHDARTSTPARTRTGCPKIHVGALGPKMTEMTAEVADGILVMPFNSGRHFRGAHRCRPSTAVWPPAGRTRDDLEIVVEAIMAVGETDEEIETASHGVRGLLSFYGSTPSYRPVLEVEGWGDLQPELNAMSKRGEWAPDVEPDHRPDGRHDRRPRHGPPSARRSWCGASAGTPTGSASTSPATR